LLQIFREDQSCVCFKGVDELMRKIGALLANESACGKIAARGREVVEQAHSWDHRARTILEHYRQRRASWNRAGLLHPADSLCDVVRK